MGILERIIKGDAAVNSFKQQLRNVLGFTPGKAVLYRTALTHRSVKDGADENNERLEYLGDAILSAIIADFLFKKYPYKEEGFLTEMRSKMVNRNQLNEIAIKMGLKKISNFNKFDSSLKMSQIFGNTLEAIVGAIYLDKGFDKCRQWVMERVIQPYLFLDDLEIFADPLVDRVFSILLDNTKRHGEKATRVKVWHVVAGDALAIVYEDDGVGIPPQNKERIFERGFGRDSGLGLFLARQVLEITGMTIRETGEWGRGARFEIAVPHRRWRIAAPPAASPEVRLLEH